MNDNQFLWDEAPIERLNNRCTHIYLVLMGIALMSMMMNLSTVYLLAPGAIIVIVARRAQQHYDDLLTRFDKAQVTLSPRTLALSQPAIGLDQRIRYRDIERTEEIKKWGVGGIRLHMENAEPVELHGFSPALASRLNQLSQESAV